jgi:hypothetical protein
MTDNENDLDVGEESVVLGKVSGRVGGRSVVIGATDERGNTIINLPMAVGYNAHAGPGSIAIGAHAWAGMELPALLAEIRLIIEQSPDASLKASFGEFMLEIEKSEKDKSKLSRLWGAVKGAAALNGSITLIEKATELLAPLLEG